ncbi:MFS general substrate transporter [Trametes versicolor FP-101664 SS1]|uniref:MFS general substrate transporter n=1 Tax=Trametes versicolor (strain FP-101664) TaxID=717944 RepID=UPI0004623BF5|nr:MFS general substrate transporter [Trametes versicolor FP-101664 SS1]EIW63415.1 MFS general substrate transporter [Trametes versicolor FP-101664 SS1]
MILAYRYVRDKRRAAKAAREAEAQGTPGAELQPLGAASSHSRQDADSQTVADSPAAASTSHGISSSTKWKLLLMVALFIPVLFETLDYTVVATAQVHIASVFNRLDLQSYIGTVYLLTSTVFLPLFASLADVWGRHWALQLSLILFAIGSAISTGSQNMATMLAGRGVAGIGAAGMLSIFRIIMADSRSLDDNNWQQSLLFFFTVGYCIGPVIGGALTTVSFRWIFAINLPCAALAIVLSFLILRGRTKGPQPRNSGLPGSEPVPETFTQKMLRIDWIGALLFMGAGILLLLALNWGSSAEWNSARVIVSFVVSGVLYLAWIAWELMLERNIEADAGATARRPALLCMEPMIPLVLFRSVDLCIVQYATFVNGMVMLVMFYFVAIFFAIVQGLSGTEAGTQLIFFAPGLGAGSLSSIFLLKVLRQPKWPIVCGGVIMCVGLGLVSYGMNLNDEKLVDGFMAMTGVGVGLSIGPLAVHVRFSQPDGRVAVVSGLTLFFRCLGGTVGLAQCGAVLNAKVNSSILTLVRSGTLDAADAAALASGLGAGVSSLQDISGLPEVVQSAVKDAFRNGSRWAFLSLLPWAALGMVATLFLSNIRDTDREAREAQAGVGQTPEVEKKQVNEATLPVVVGEPRP